MNVLCFFPSSLNPYNSDWLLFCFVFLQVKHMRKNVSFKAAGLLVLLPWDKAWIAISHCLGFMLS